MNQARRAVYLFFAASPLWSIWLSLDLGHVGPSSARDQQRAFDYDNDTNNLRNGSCVARRHEAVALMRATSRPV
jgi:hypothetical protein